MARLQSVLIAIGALLFMQPALGDVILKPPNGARTPVALVLIPSGEVDPSQYKPLATSIQHVCTDYSLWVGIPQFPMDSVLSSAIGEAISRVILSMQAEGMAVKTQLFFAAHSPVSAIPLQDYLVKNTTLAQSTAGVYSKYLGLFYPFCPLFLCRANPVWLVPATNLSQFPIPCPHPDYWWRVGRCGQTN